jgi:hypothetical protein
LRILGQPCEFTFWPGQSAFALLETRGSLRLVADVVHEDDALCLALTCRALRDALWARFPRRPAGDALAGVRVRTRDAAVVGTVGRLAWASNSIENSEDWQIHTDPHRSANGRSTGRSTQICATVARHGALASLQWARANGYQWDWRTCSCAARGGHLAVLQWARANGCDWSTVTCADAGRGGHLEVLQWAKANGCDWNAVTCYRAAEGGHLEVLQWARANGCDWNTNTCHGAARGGHLEVLQWTRANGCD